MANYAVTDYVTDPQNTAAKVAALLETYVETVDDSKTILAMGILAQGNQFVGYCLHKA